MSNTTMMEQLVAQSLLGTSCQILDLNAFPTAIRHSAENILATSDTTEGNFLKLVAMVLSNNQTTTDLEINSFSLEQVDLYQKALIEDLNSSKNSKSAGNISSNRKGKSKSTPSQDPAHQVTSTPKTAKSDSLESQECASLQQSLEQQSPPTR